MASWSIEDIEEANPATEGQRGLLKHLLNIGATSEKQLSDASERLDSLGSPFVAVFCQLPYRVDGASEGLNVHGTRSSIDVEVHCIPSQLRMDLFGNLKSIEYVDDEQLTNDGNWITHVTAYIRLWDKRARLHQKYVQNVGKPAFMDVPLCKIENWMDLPEAQMALPTRRAAMLTGSRFRSEVVRRLRYELLAAVNRIARVYSTLTLKQHPELGRLYGYFGMLTPGQIAGANAPLPIQQHFLRSTESSDDAFVPDENQFKRLISRAAHSPDARNDVMVGQLIAMNSLRAQGEPELALMGCATALEWFLNERFPSMTKVTRSNRRNSASLSDFAKSTTLVFLDESKKAKLISLAHARNQIAHGRPRMRSSSPHGDASVAMSNSDNDARESLFFAMEVYRLVNLANN